MVINLAGQGIADKRWTRAVKKQLRESRLITTKNLINYLQTADKKPELLISGSAIGYYGDQGDYPVDEYTSCGSGFSSKRCVDWEHVA